MNSNHYGDSNDILLKQSPKQEDLNKKIREICLKINQQAAKSLTSQLVPRSTHSIVIYPVFEIDRGGCSCPADYIF